MEFKCKRCGYATPHHYTLLRHLRRTRPCPPSIADVSCEDQLKEEVDAHGKTLECPTCHKAFKTHQGLLDHEPIHRKVLPLPKPTATASENYKAQYETLRTMYQELLEQQQGVPSPSLPVKLNPFGKEEADYLVPAHLKAILEQKTAFLQNVAKAIHFNADHPENMNVFISNLRGKHAVIFDGVQFTIKLKDETMDRLLNDTVAFVEAHLSQTELAPKVMAYIQEKIKVIKTVDDKRQLLKEKLELMCYNEREQVRKNMPS